MATIDRAATSHQFKNPQPIPSSAIAAFAAGAVIFGVLAGLALWKGGGLSFKNAKFSYLGFGAVAAGSLSLSAAAVLRIYNQCIVPKKMHSLLDPDLLAKNRDIDREDIDQQIHNFITTPQTSTDSSPDFATSFSLASNELKREILARLLQLQKEGNLGNFPPVSAIPASALPSTEHYDYPDDFMALYLTDKVDLNQIEDQALLTKFLNYIIDHRQALLSLINPKFWPANRSFTDAFLASHVDTDFTTQPKSFKNAIIQYILNYDPDKADRIPLQDWPEGRDFSAAFLNGQLRRKDYKLDPKSRDFKAMIQHIIQLRPEFSNLIDPSDLPQDTAYSDLFKRNYLQNIRGDKLMKVETPIREEFIRFMIEENLNIKAIPISEWPENVPFTKNYLSEVSSPEGFKLTDEQPPRFKNAMIRHIITSQAPKAHLIEPSDLPVDENYQERFINVYLSKKRLNPDDFAKIPDGIRQKFIDQILHKKPHFADLVDLSCLTTAPNPTFIECSLGGNPSPNLDKMHADVKAAFQQHLEKQLDVVVESFNKTDVVELFYLIYKCRNEVAQKLLDKLTPDNIREAAMFQMSKLAAARLPKDPDYLPTNLVLKRLWAGQGAAFAFWIMNEERFKQKPLIDFLYNDLEEKDKRAAEDRTLKLIGFQSQYELRNVKENLYYQILQTLEAAKLPTIIDASFKRVGISIPSAPSKR